MQEKKRFESTLDESVASGLNAGIEVLMNQVGLRNYSSFLTLRTQDHVFRSSTSFKRRPYQDNTVLPQGKIWSLVLLKVVRMPSSAWKCTVVC